MFASETIVLGVPFIWALVGLWAGLSEKRIVRRAFDITLAAHYVWIPATLFILWLGGSELFRRNHAIPWKREPAVVVCVVGIYLAGQIALWRVLARMRRDSRCGVPSDAVVEPRSTFLGRVLPWMGAGFGCGLVLLLVSAVLLKMGGYYRMHGLQLALVTLYSSPVSLLPTRAVFVGTPLWWAFLGLLLALVERPWARRGLWLALLAHYAGAMFLLPNRGFGAWRHFEKDWNCLANCSDEPGALIAGLSAYLIVQAALWAAVVWRIQRTREISGRWQYSLRTLVIAVLVVAIGLKWALAEFDRARRCRMAVATIGAIGGHVYWVYRDYEDPGYRAIGPTRVLRRVDLSGTEAADRQLSYLKELPNLYVVDLSNTKVTDAGLLHVASLRTLRYLKVAGSGVTNAGIQRLRQMRPDVILVPRERRCPTW